MLNGMILQVFLLVVIVGSTVIIFFFVVRNLFSPRKIQTLRNYIKTENYKMAVKTAKDILAKNRNNVEAHYLLGEAYYNQQKYELALIEFKTTEKSGSYSDIDERKMREKLAALYIEMEDLDEALKEYILLTKKYPTDHVYLFKVGELFEMKEMSQQSIKYYVDSVKLNNSYAPALVNLGVLLYRTKNYADAGQYLKSAIHKDPNNFKSYYYLGLLNKVENNFKGALKNFEKSVRDKDFKIKSLLERGMIYMMQAKFEDAVIELERALKNCEEESNLKNHVRYTLAICYEKKRNITEAISLWEDIYALKPNFRDVAEKLANYQDLRLDDRMKDFLTATDIEFHDLCVGIVNAMGLNVMDEDMFTKDAVQFTCLEPDSKWRNMKKKPKLIYISRKNDIIEQKVIRDLNEKMREKAIIRGVVITSSTYSKSAIAFAKERPIELIDKNGLQELLKLATQ